MPLEKQFPVYGDNGLRGTLLAASRFLDNAPQKKIRLEDGSEITVPTSLLEPQRDGSFYLHSSPQSSQEPEASQQPAYQAARQTSAPPAPVESVRQEAVRPEPVRSEQVRPEQVRPEQMRPEQMRPEQVRSEPARSEQKRQEPARPEQVRNDTPPNIARNPETLQPPAGEALFREDCEIERVTVRKLIDKPAETRQDGDTLIIPLMEEVWVVEKKLLLREELHITRRKNQIEEGLARPIRRDEIEKAG